MNRLCRVAGETEKDPCQKSLIIRRWHILPSLTRVSDPHTERFTSLTCPWDNVRLLHARGGGETTSKRPCLIGGARDHTIVCGIDSSSDVIHFHS